MCCVYGADGKCDHMIRPEVAAQLKYRYMHMQREHPGDLANLGAGSFAEELHRLAVRYQHQARTQADQCKHWGIPPQLKHVLLTSIMATSERFSSPLTVHPCTPAYHSAFERDRIFGASRGAFSSK
jgi:hypothetical protein